MGTGRQPDPKVVEFRPSSREYSNTAEGRFAQKAREAGWAVSKRGWPDFLCFKDGELIAVEVKPDQGPVVGRKPLRLEQSLVLRWLASQGIKCYVWSPRRGFERIRPDQPTEQSNRRRSFQAKLNTGK